jgi:hypothetical protein
MDAWEVVDQWSTPMDSIRFQGISCAVHHALQMHIPAARRSQGNRIPDHGEEPHANRSPVRHLREWSPFCARVARRRRRQIPSEKGSSKEECEKCSKNAAIPHRLRRSNHTCPRRRATSGPPETKCGAPHMYLRSYASRDSADLKVAEACQWNLITTYTKHPVAWLNTCSSVATAVRSVVYVCHFLSE